MGWRKPKQSSLLVPLSPASQCCFVQPFATCFSKYQPCWNDWEVHHCVQQSQELTSGALNPLLQMQIFCHDRNEEGSDPSSSVPALLPNPDVGLESWWLQQTVLHAKKPMALGCLPASLAPAAPAAVDRARGRAREAVTSQQHPYRHQTRLLTCDLQDLRVLLLFLLLTSYTFLGRSKLVVCPSSQGWCNAVLSILMRCPKPICLGWNCGAWKSWSILQQSQSCAARTLLH